MSSTADGRVQFAMVHELGRYVLAGLLSTVLIGGLPRVSVAQQPGPAAAGAGPVVAQQTAKAPKAAAKAVKAPDSAAPGGSDGALRQRVENLEEQLVDMQVLVGTLETLAKSGGASSASPTYRADSAGSGSGGSADTARVSGLESQVRNLSTQVQQLSDQVRALGGQPRRADAGASSTVAPPRPAAPSTIDNVLAQSGDSPPTNAPSGSFGGGGDMAAAPLPPIVGAAAGGGDGGNPKQLYETAYGFLLQQDYGAAETAFDDFLKRYPSDGLAGNAQFWLGESFFVRGQFKAAAGAFLKGYQSYGRSAKAPDSLLKLAMSLGRLGQKDQACASFAELNTRFPAASADVKSRAVAERQRTGCS
jgi:tol-pal system protein YbgF